MKSVQEVLSKGKLPKDFPPTKEDIKMRLKHAPESVKYNIDKHLKDHGDNAGGQIDKVHMVDPKRAHKLAEESIVTVKKVLADLESRTTKNCKECKHG